MSGQEDASSPGEERSRRALQFLRVAAPADLKRTLKKIPIAAGRRVGFWDFLRMPRSAGFWPYGLTAAAAAAIVAFVLWRSPSSDHQAHEETIADRAEAGSTLADFWVEENGEDDEL